MFLFGTIGTCVQIALVLFLATAIFLGFVGLLISYMVAVFNEENIKAEKRIAYTGYYAIASMIALFLIVCFGFKNDVIYVSREYYGLFAAFGALALIPELVYFDIKQIRFIKDLSPEKQKEYGVSVKDRIPLMGVVSILIIINMALFGLCVESFAYVLSGVVA